MPEPLWITYAWADNDEGDFSYLVQKLNDAGIPTLYDKIALIPGRRLWSQIADNITSEKLSAWAYLITPISIQSSACQEELSYALQRAIETKGEEFPLIGLLHNVSLRDVPIALKVRLCINLANPDWIEEIRAGVLGMAPRRHVNPEDPFILRTHQDYCGRKGHSAIEIRPRFGEIHYWRLAFPIDGPQPITWGTGPANGGGIGGAQINAIDGEINIADIQMKFVGAGNPLTASTSAYAEFDGNLPKKFFFGAANEPFGIESQGHIVEINR
jgi:hypothetical protein